jgi:hypothetical protein
MKRIALLVSALSVLLGTLMSPARPSQAQGSVEDVIFGIVAQNLGIYRPTKGELDAGRADLAFPFSYLTRALDLNPTRGGLACSGVRVLGANEIIQGYVGFEVRVTVQGKVYTFRTDSTGNQVIRCQNGQPASMTFGVAPSRGAQLTGEEVVDLAMRHLSGYLNLDRTITLAEVKAFEAALANDEEADYPYSVRWRWDPVIYSNSAFNCPAADQTFTNGDVAAYRITLTVQGRVFQYRASPDGRVLLLCLGGRADPSSVGI